MINGNEYAWEDIEIVADGNPVPLVGVTGIEYISRKEHTNVYGRGAKPIAVARGREEFEGKITMLQSQLEAWQRTMPKGRSLTKKTPFNIAVAYAPENGVITVDQLVYCRIGEVSKTFTNEDGNMVVELPLAIGEIKYNV
jgi:hypothetical protein